MWTSENAIGLQTKAKLQHFHRLLMSLLSVFMGNTLPTDLITPMKYMNSYRYFSFKPNTS